MTLEEMNRLLTVEYPRLGELAWIRSDDRRLWFPFVREEYGADGYERPIYNHIANPSTGLIEVRPVIDFEPLLPDFQGGETKPPLWVLSRRAELSQQAWFDSYKTLENYQGSRWIPVYTSAHDLVPLHLINEPTESETRQMITFLKSTAMPKPGELSYNWVRKQNKMAADVKAANKYAVKHSIGAMGRVLHEPGTKSGGASYPATSAAPAGN